MKRKIISLKKALTKVVKSGILVYKNATLVKEREKMKIKQLTAKIEEAIKRHNINQLEAEDCAEYSYYGLRFENKDREISEICNNSRDNADREDERDFPEFGTDDYAKMPELDGTSAWEILEDGSFDEKVYKGKWQSENDDLRVVTDHCYIIGGDAKCTHDNPDDGEIVICDAVVIEELF